LTIPESANDGTLSDFFSGIVLTKYNHTCHKSLGKIPKVYFIENIGVKLKSKALLSGKILHLRIMKNNWLACLGAQAYLST